MQNKGLQNFGNEFQIKLITCLITDTYFCSRIYDILKPEYFGSSGLIWLCDVILKYYREYHSMATMPVLKYEVDTIEDELLKIEVISILRDSVKYTNSSDLKFIKDGTLEFCKNQELTHAIMESVDLLKQSKFEDIKKLIDDALSVGDDKHVGLDYLKDVDLRYVDNVRNPIPTGWSAVDELMKGGLSGGELGVIVGPGGSGKSWVLAKMCANAMDAGYNALYVTLELSKEYVGIRLDSILTGINSDDLKYNIDVVKNRLKRLRGSGTVQWYPTKRLSIIGLRALLDKLRLLDNMPDVLFLDYADLMKLLQTKNKRKDEDLQELYEELRGLSGEYNIPIWTASQANRGSHDDDVEFVHAGMISESMGKHFTADFMMSILRKHTDKISNTARFHIIKSRIGADGITLMSHMDTSNGDIEIYAKKSKEERELENRLVETSTDMRANMQNRFQQFLETGEN